MEALIPAWATTFSKRFVLRSACEYRDAQPGGVMTGTDTAHRMGPRFDAAEMIETILDHSDHTRLPEWSRKLNVRMGTLERKTDALKELEDAIDSQLDQLAHQAQHGHLNIPSHPPSRRY